MKEQSKDEVPSFELRVKEETPARIVFEWVCQPATLSDNLGCITPLLIVIGLLIFGVFEAYEYFFNNTLSWLFWIVVMVVLVLEFFLIRLIYSFTKTKDTVLEKTVTVDLDRYHATRIEKLQSGEVHQIELDIKHVNRVRIQMEEHGHHFRLYLESPNSEPFQISIAFINSSYSIDALIAHGEKIGKFLDKPVIRQHTDLGNLISEEVLQA